MDTAVTAPGVGLAFERRLARIEEAVRNGSWTTAYRLAAGLASRLQTTSAARQGLDLAVAVRDRCEGNEDADVETAIASLRGVL